MKLEKFGLDYEILKAIKELGFDEFTEIQEKALPKALHGFDLVVQSKTGSGKTAIFGLCIVQKVKAEKKIQALIIAPTRELCLQISKMLKDFAKFKKIRIVEIIGGESILVQERELKEAQIVVATPGRLLDLIRNSKINFNGLRFLVIDEIDRMVDLGFIDDIEKIIAKLPTRQTIVLSATLSKDVKKFIEKHVKKALYVYGEKSVEEKFLKQIYYEVERKDKFSLLVFLLKKNYDGLSLVFCKKRQETDLVAKNLRKNGFDAIALHGGLKHKKRLSNIHDVINQKVDVVVATDLAARGLDLKGIKYVYNYDLPEAKEDYIHRVGRTARIGKEGVAITFLVPEEKSRLKKIVEEYNIKIQQEKIPNFPYVPFHVKLKRKYMSTKKK